jgi:phosphoglycerate dehydrogenase-like enzyme
VWCCGPGVTLPGPTSLRTEDQGTSTETVTTARRRFPDVDFSEDSADPEIDPGSRQHYRRGRVPPLDDMRTSGPEEPLVIAVLHPPDFDPASFMEHFGPTDRRIVIRKGSYFDDPDLRIAKRHNQPMEEIRSREPPLTQETLTALEEAEVILAVDVPVDIASLAPRLRWLQAFGAGIRQFNERSLFERGVLISTAAGVGAGPISEFVIGRLLEVLRQFRNLQEMQANRIWEHTGGGKTLGGKTMGILGLGAIGRALAKRAQAMDMRVVGTRRHYVRGSEVPFVNVLFGPDETDEVLRCSDVLVICLPETADTENLVGRRELGLMKRGSVLCNVARGSILDEGALVSALVSGHLSAAILDVQRQEPMPKDDPLWSAPNVYLSSHSSGGVMGHSARVEALFRENLRHYLAEGRPHRNLVDPSNGY